MTNSPVLFLIFNRLDTTKQVFQAIREAKPPRLYIACDGPRPSRPSESIKVSDVRDFVLNSIDWPCQVQTLIRDKNLGCKLAVSQAITWFFEQEPEGIILEDDCLPDQSFFQYCDELLMRHREHTKVMCISGDNFITEEANTNNSYYFSKYVHIWGWASWRRAWNNYTPNISKEDVSNSVKLIEKAFGDLPKVKKFWKNNFRAVSEGKIDTWDYQWVYTIWNNEGVCCVPKVNLITNIGFGPNATHTDNPDSKHSKLLTGRMEFPMSHPAEIVINRLGDHWEHTNVFGIGIKSSVKNRIKGIITKIWPGGK